MPDREDEEITENPRHEAQRQANREGGQYGRHPGASDYLKPKKQVYAELDEALDIDTPAVKKRRE